LAAPLHRRNEIPPASVYTENVKRAAVLLFCYPKGDQMYLSLIKRSEYQGVHSGQISFPGGKSELSDASLEETALRECREELGVSLEAVAKLIPLTPLYIPPSNFLVSPFLGIAKTPLKFTLQKSEVDAVIEVPLAEFLNKKSEVLSEVLVSEGVTHEVPAFKLKDRIVWGATAMMLIEIKTMINQVLKK